MHEIKTHRCGNGLNEQVRVESADDPDPKTGANYKYEVLLRKYGVWGKATRIEFQKGLIDEQTEGGPNGISNEALLAIVIDRLQGFQKKEFACRENAIVLTKLEECMHWLQARTRDRAERDVLNKMEK